MDPSSLDDDSWHGEEDVLREFIEQKYRESQGVAFFANKASSSSSSSVVVGGGDSSNADRDAGAEWKEAYDLFKAENATVADTLASTAQQTEENMHKLTAIQKSLKEIRETNQQLAESTKNVKLYSSNLESALHEVEKRLEYFSIASQIEATMKVGPSGNVKSYYAQFDQLTEAETFFQAHKSYIDADNVLRQIKDVKAAGIAASEQFFGTLIRRCSGPVTLELGGALLTKKQQEATVPSSSETSKNDNGEDTTASDAQQHFSQYIIEPRMVEELKVTARKMASIGVTSCASIYATNRVNFVLGSLAKMNTDSIKAVTENVSSASQYVAHTHPIYAYIKTVLSVLSFERDFAEDILSHQFRTVWGQIVDPVLEQLIHTVERAQRNVSVLCVDNTSRIYRYGFFIVADVYEAFRSSLDKMDVITRLEVNKHSVFMDGMEASRKKQMGILVKSLNDFVMLLQLEQAPSPEGMVKQTFPRDGTVHEITALAVTFLKKTMDYKPTLEEITTSILLNSTAKKDSSTTCLGQFIINVINTLLQGLQNRADKEKPESLVLVFLLNNHNHLLKGITSGAIQDTVGRKFDVIVKRLTDLVSSEKDQLKDTWHKAVVAATLDDPTQVESVTKKAYIKKKFETFNKEVEALFALQKVLFIPDVNVRDEVRSMIVASVVPVYTAFLNRYDQVHFTSNRAKYIRYSPETLKTMIGTLFEGIATASKH